MTSKIAEQCKAAGLTQDEINALQEFYAVRAAILQEREGGKGVRRDSAVYKQQNKTAIDNRGNQSDFDCVTNLSHALFGGFTPNQVRRLLSVCRYRGVPVSHLLSLMHALRKESWKHGWIRTRDQVEHLSKTA